jgi:hypothetical protein
MTSLVLVALAGVVVGSWLYRFNRKHRGLVEDVI